MKSKQIPHVPNISVVKKVGNFYEKYIMIANYLSKLKPLELNNKDNKASLCCPKKFRKCMCYINSLTTCFMTAIKAKLGRQSKPWSPDSAEWNPCQDYLWEVPFIEQTPFSSRGCFFSSSH